MRRLFAGLALAGFIASNAWGAEMTARSNKISIVNGTQITTLGKTNRRADGFSGGFGLFVKSGQPTKLSPVEFATDQSASPTALLSKQFVAQQNANGSGEALASGSAAITGYASLNGGYAMCEYDGMMGFGTARFEHVMTHLGDSTCSPGGPVHAEHCFVRHKTTAYNAVNNPDSGGSDETINDGVTYTGDIPVMDGEKVCGLARWKLEYWEDAMTTLVSTATVNQNYGDTNMHCCTCTSGACSKSVVRFSKGKPISEGLL